MNAVATFFQYSYGAAATILRNDKGETLAAGSWILNNLLDATTTEVVAMQKELMLAEELGCNEMVMESDLLERIQACVMASLKYGVHTRQFLDMVSKGQKELVQ